MTQSTNLLTTREVADMLGVTPAGVSRMVSRGKLAVHMRAGGGTGGAMLFRRRDVQVLQRRRANESAKHTTQSA